MSQARKPQALARRACPPSKALGLGSRLPRALVGLRCALFLALLGGGALGLEGCRALTSVPTSVPTSEPAASVSTQAPASPGPPPPPQGTSSAPTVSAASSHGVSSAPELPALEGDGGRSRTFELRTVERVLDVRHGVRYRARTYGGTVPGPLLHVRQGDEVTVTLINGGPSVPLSKASLQPAGLSKPSACPPALSTQRVRPTQGTSPSRATLAARGAYLHTRQSLIIHGSQLVAPDLNRSVAPGERLALHFRAAYPGVFAYHSGMPMVCEQVADGLFGALIVEPQAGWPTHADRSYVVVQSELYAQPLPAGSSAQAPNARLDPVTVRTGQVSYLLHNGRIFGTGEPPLRALPGQRVRLYLLNAGPNRAAHLSLEGLVFDRVYLGGNPQNLLYGLSMVDLGPGSGAVAEVVVPDSGRVLLTDHHLAAASEGAAGMLSTLEVGEVSTTQAGVAPPGRTGLMPPLASTGAGVFAQRCALCHTPRVGAKVGWEGPDLALITRRHDPAWIDGWLLDPQALIARNARARQLRDRYGYTMPAQRTLTQVERQALHTYLRWRDAQPR
jgi:nitrite reductase (NO-forming)